MRTPPTHYAKSGDASIAYQIVGDGPVDLVLVLGFATHLELQWESPPFARLFERISSFSRLIIFDKRGTGLSDPVAEVPTLEQRVDDVRAVMDAAGAERAALFGISEGGPMSVLFAATHPERATALVLHGAMGRTTEAPDYPWASPAEALRESAAEFIVPCWGQQAEGMVELFAPSFADDPETIEFTARMERTAASPAMVQQIFEMFLDIDVRAILPTIHVPTLVLHRRGDRVVNRRAGQELAAQIPGARYVELPGIDHAPWAGDSESVVGEIEEFLTGARSTPEPDRVLSTVMFSDIVGSTERAAELGDTRWRALISAHHAAVRRALTRFGGHEVKTTGDGFLATFDGPARAIRCAHSIAEAARSLGLEDRIGLHAGEVELMDGDVGGIAVHIAARVASLAAPGEVLVSSTVKDLVAGSGIRFVDRGEKRLRGVADERRLFAAAP
ncbi:MAG TPA: adenylate/guanylate cyclase domain-containing protein [Gaiellaceae bacterium]|nr:adenylate/guanylate cyclase domain-containing protein [Gaiellaceae bacterium]